MFQFCYNDNGLRGMDMLKAIKNVKKYGYDAIEISFHENHIHPMHYKVEDVKKVKDLCEQLDLKIAAVAAGADNLLSDVPFEPSLIHSQKDKRALRVQLLKNSIDIAYELGTDKVIFASGKKTDEVTEEDAMDYLYNEIKELLAYNKNMTLLIEPEPGFFIGTTTKAIELIKKVADERFKLNLDLGHVNVCEKDYLDKIAKALPYAKHIHIEDFKDKVHYHLIPGTGEMDFDKIFQLIKANHFAEVISVELYTFTDNWEQALGQSISYLNNFK